MPSDMLTPAQVAECLRVGRATVYRLIRDQKLTALRAGRAYRIPRQDLDAFLLAHSAHPALREALFTRLEEVAARHPGVDGDELLAELERADEERVHRPAS
jgi:excisionase family DNA binding protein